MTQIQSEQQKNSNQITNQPIELSSIYKLLIKITESIPSQYNHNSQNNHDKLISIPSPLNLITLTCHAFLISNSFHLTTCSNQQSNSNQDSFLFTDWDSILNPNQKSIHFTYSHLQSSLSFEFNFTKIGNRISIATITLQDDRLFTWNLSIPEYMESSDFPIKLNLTQEPNSIGFRSTTHLLDLVSHFVNEILNPLLPDLFPLISSINERSTELPRSTGNENVVNSHQTPQPIPTPSYTSTPTNQPIPASLEIGRSDLEPIGTSNLQIPSLYNHIPRGDLDQPSGMFVHPQHPIFNRPPQFSPSESFHPPGARFDPIGPNSSSPAFSRPRPDLGSDLDPMGGLGQGLPLQNPRLGFRSNRPDFNEFSPPGAGGSGYDNMFM